MKRMLVGGVLTFYGILNVVMNINDIMQWSNTHQIPMPDLNQAIGMEVWQWSLINAAIILSGAVTFIFGRSGWQNRNRN